MKLDSAGEKPLSSSGAEEALWRVQPGLGIAGPEGAGETGAGPRETPGAGLGARRRPGRLNSASQKDPPDTPALALGSDLGSRSGLSLSGPGFLFYKSHATPCPRSGGP